MKIAVTKINVLKMKIFINGKQKSIVDDITVRSLLEQLGMGQQRVALEINREIVPRSLHAEHTFHEGDQVEIIQAIGGG